MNRRLRLSSILFRLAVIVALLPQASAARAQLDDDEPAAAPGPARVIHGAGPAAPSSSDDADDDDDKIKPDEALPAPPRRAPVARPSEEAPAEEAAPPAPERKPVRSSPAEVEEAPAPAPAPAAPQFVTRSRRVKKCKAHHKHCHWVTIKEKVPAGSAGQSVSTRRVLASPASGSTPAGGSDDVIPAHDVEGSTTASGRPADAPEAPSSMSFDLVQESGPSAADAAIVERKVKTRRSMLEVHQAFGIATSALMLGTVITGQLNYSDRFGGGGSSGQFEIWHSTLEMATVLSFATTGLLALFAPVPFEKKSEGIDSVTIHKWSMLVATIGMASEIPLGIYTVSREGYVNQGTMAITHLIIGYITAAAMTTGVSALFF